MADLSPFRGVLFSNGSRAGALLAPPYDVLGAADRARYAALDPHNVVRLILPDGDGDTKYAHAAEMYRGWRSDGTLVRDDKPALYRYLQTFEAEGQTHTRKGFIALLRLERFGEGSVKPHERTLSGPKMDRLKLMRACHAHFSQIFLLYGDPERKTDRAFEPHEQGTPVISGRTLDGVEQSLFRVTDPGCIRTVTQFLRERPVYIADGHHRYETMVTLRDELRAAHPKAAADAASAIHFGCVFLSNMDDPQLIVLPTHRVVHSLAQFDAEALVARAAKSFSIREAPWADAAEVRSALAEASRTAPSFAMAVPGRKTIAYFTVRKEAAAEIPAPEVARSLDVTVLHTLVLEGMLGITKEAQEKQTNLAYLKDTGQALAAARAGEQGAQAVFIMHPTAVAQVRAVADAGEVMPQKSTFFVPKLASGIVMNHIDPEERIVSP